MLFHGIGAAFAACCYVPQKKVRGWSWQSYWLIQAAVCWLILPFLGAYLTIPDFTSVTQQVPTDVMLRTFLLGAIYGIGGTAFGMAIRHVGFSITYSMAIGISTVIGTLYAIAKGDSDIMDAGSHLNAFLTKRGSNWISLGIVVGSVGILFCGIAGRRKERDHGQTGRGKIGWGLLLCLVAGVLSAVYSMALAEGEQIAKVAVRFAKDREILGVDAVTFCNNAIYPFANAGAFVTTALYCFFLHGRQKTLGEAFLPPQVDGERSWMIVNWSLAILTGCLWYSQFFFYGFGHHYIQQVSGFAQTCWAVHMILLILLGTLMGILCKEWKGCRKPTYAALTTAVVLLIVGKLMLDYGNHLGTAKPHVRTGTRQSQELPAFR